METTARIIRALIEDAPGGRPPPREPREQAVYERILDAGRTVFAHAGRHTVTMAKFAKCFGATPATIGRYICDLDYLLSLILIEHLRAVSRAMGDIPADAPDIPATRRAAYLGATRTGLGALTEAHLLLVRDRHLLPPDLAEGVERIRFGIGMNLAGDRGGEALHLLDHPGFTPQLIEAMLACPIPPPPPRCEIAVIESEPAPVCMDYVPDEARRDRDIAMRRAIEEAIFDGAIPNGAIRNETVRKGVPWTWETRFSIELPACLAGLSSARAGPD